MDKKTQGKKNRESGQRFERKVRADLESKGWVVDRWSNNVEVVGSKNPFEWEGMGKLVPARPHTRFVIGKGEVLLNALTGFPDFVAFQIADLKDVAPTLWKEMEYQGWHKVEKSVYEIVGVECKSNGYLTKEEKEKCAWLIDNNIFSKILIAKKSKEKRGQIEYVKFILPNGR